MHPAYSVIFFTVSSGFGFGVLILAGLLAVLGRLPQAPWLGAAVMAFALATAAAGLMSSTLHLGHPERAWRAFSQWRTSWLSREGVVSVLVFPPALVFAWGWVFADPTSPGFAAAGGLAAIAALVTVVCTGMIYQSLVTIRAWARPIVTPIYVVLALAGASLWLAFAWRLAGALDPLVLHLPFAVVLAAWVMKVWYWWRLDREPGGPTVQSATGLGREGASVRLLESPHTQENFVMREMGYRIARRHAKKLRVTAQVLAFALPLVLTEATALLPTGAFVLATIGALLAALSAVAGIAVERWLFFAEARHAVTLYYGAHKA